MRYPWLPWLAMGLTVSLRRDLLALLILVVAVTVDVGAQAPPPRVVFIAAGDEAFFRPLGDRFLRGMQALGHAEGRTFRLEVLYAQGDPARSVALIRDAVASRPDVLVVGGLTNARRAREATSSIPIVVGTSSDLVDAGIVASFSRPGGNITGITDLADEVAVKRLELLSELSPRPIRVALLNNPDFPGTAKIESRVRQAAERLGITVVPLYARDPAGVSVAVDSLGARRANALLVGGDALFNVTAAQIIQGATSQRVPVAHYWPGTAELGAILTHGADFLRNYERAAYYVDRILKGAKPSDLPVEQPTRYELVLNPKAAAALGITFPREMLLRADRVIE